MSLTKEEILKMLDCYYGNIFIADGQGIIRYVNDSYYTTLGLGQEEFLGRHVSELMQMGMFDKSMTLEVLEKKREVIDILTDGHRESRCAK